MCLLERQYSVSYSVFIGVTQLDPLKLFLYPSELPSLPYRHAYREAFYPCILQAQALLYCL